MTTGIGIFVLGLCIGSFLSAAIYRAHTKGKSLVKGRSACPKCGHKLNAKDLIPVISYLFQMGKCRYCK
ncbi:MAG: prepilin peptidase, partial [Patescibacteria group bacterium]